jgi:hypothetical protein
MVSRLDSPGKMWVIAHGGGLLAWLIGVSFAKFMPPPLQFVVLAAPIGCQLTALSCLPGWRREGRKNDFMEALAEKEWLHTIQQQFGLSMAARDIDAQMQMEALMDLSGVESVNPSVTSSMLTDSQPISLEQEIRQATGAIGVELWQYLTTGKGGQLTGADGWVRLDRLRGSWGRNRNLNTETLRTLINQLGRILLIKWKDGKMMEFRLDP